MKQIVHFITDWWDGPKSGIADFNNEPHYFERKFDTELDDWTDLFFLRPLTAEEYLLQEESYRIFLEWINDKKSNQPHPALNPENYRFHEIRQLLIDFESNFFSDTYTGTFTTTKKEITRKSKIDKTDLGLNDFNSFEVIWTKNVEG